MLAAYPMKERTITRPTPFWKQALETFICALGFCAMCISFLFIVWMLIVAVA